MCDKIARIIPIRQINGLPTVPVSSDPRNGDWIETDIFIGEFAMDTNTGILYTRSSSGIVEASKGSSVKRYKALLSQQLNSDPTSIVLENSIGAIVWTRVGAGVYRGTLSSSFVDEKTFLQITSSSKDGICFIERISSSVVEIKTAIADLKLDDDILNQTSVLIEVYQ